MSDGISDGNRKPSLAEDLEQQLAQSTPRARQEDFADTYFLRGSEVQQIIRLLQRQPARLYQVQQLGKELEEIARHLKSIEQQCKALVAANKQALAQGIEMTVPATLGGVTVALTVTTALDTFVIIERDMLAHRDKLAKRLTEMGINPIL